MDLSPPNLWIDLPLWPLWPNWNVLGRHIGWLRTSRYGKTRFIYRRASGRLNRVDRARPNVWYVKDLAELIYFCLYSGLSKEETFTAITGHSWVDLNLFRQYTGKDYRKIIDLALDSPEMYKVELKRYQIADGQTVDD